MNKSIKHLDYPNSINNPLLFNKQKNNGYDITPSNTNIKKINIDLLMKPISTTKYKSKQMEKINKIKIHKNISMENNIDFNNNNLSSSFTNTNNQNDKNFRKFSGHFINKNKEFYENKDDCEIKNIKLSRNNYNSRNGLQIDYKKDINILNFQNNDNNSKKINNSNSNPNINKSNLDLKNQNNNNVPNNYRTLNLKNDNNNYNNSNLLPINSYNNRETKKNYKIDNSKKFSIIDIPAPIIINKNENENKNLFKNKNLTSKEKAYYILSKSPVLSLKFQLIFSRSSENVKNIISKKEILYNYESYFNNKIKDYENKITEYNKQITSVFTSSKIAEISLNFITNKKEEEFCDIYNNLLYNQNEYYFIYYKNYIKIIYYIIGESIEENKDISFSDINDNKLLINLYSILKKRHYNNIKDYLYFLYISCDNKKKENYFMKNLDKINDIINKEVPKLLNFYESFKMCKFIHFTYFLIKEIVEYGNKIKNIIKLKIETKNFVDQLKENLDKFKTKFCK